MTIFLPQSAPPPPPPPDTTPPSAPGQPAGTSTVAGRADLTWARATDDIATSLTYSIFRDGGATAVGQVTSAAATVSFSRQRSGARFDAHMAGQCIRWHQHRTAQRGLQSGHDRHRSAAACRARLGRLQRRAHRVHRRHPAGRRQRDGFAHGCAAQRARGCRQPIGHRSGRAVDHRHAGVHLGRRARRVGQRARNVRVDQAAQRRRRLHRASVRSTRQGAVGARRRLRNHADDHHDHGHQHVEPHRVCA